MAIRFLQLKKQKKLESFGYAGMGDLESIIEWLPKTMEEKYFKGGGRHISYFMVVLGDMNEWQAGYLGILMQSGKTPLEACFNLAVAIKEGNVN